MSLKLTLESLTDHVVQHFIATGNDLTAAEIAETSGHSIASVRRVLASTGGCPKGLTTYQEHRPSFSRNYRSFASGSHRVWVYGPTRATLREKLLATGASK